MAISQSERMKSHAKATALRMWFACAFLGFTGSAFSELKVHQMEEGETFATLAQVYLGGEEFADELRSYNGLNVRESPEVGFLIAIPGPLRAEAHNNLEQGARALRRAVDAQAKQYARAEFESAARTEEAARAAMSDAVYCQAVALSTLAVVRSDRARRAADENARVPRDATAVAVGGLVEYSIDNQVSWNQANPSTVFPVQSVIRTAAGARIALRLDDGSQLTLGENSVFKFRDYLTDLRNGEVSALLAVPRGGIEGEVPVNPGQSSRTILQAGRVVNVLKGTSLRARVDAEENSYTEVLRGHADVEFDGKRVVVPEAHGAFLDAKRKKLVTTALLLAPVIDSRFGAAHTTARQEVALTWASPMGGKASAYRVEVANDEAFVDVVDCADVESLSHTTLMLAEGDYFWRVSAIDEYGLQGYASALSRLTIIKDLLVDIKCEGPVQQLGERLIAGGDTVFRPVPRQESTSVVRYEYSVNGSPFKPVDDGIQLTRDGRFDVRVRGVAADNDVGEEAALVAWVDATGPRVTLDISPPFAEADGGRMVRAELNATDETGLDRIEVSVGKSAFALYEGPMVLPAKKNHLLRFRAWDVLGNASPAMSFRVRADQGG